MKIKKILYTVFFIIIFGAILSIPVQANSSANNKTLEEIVRTETSIDVNNLDLGQVIQAYDELTSKYTNQELADILENSTVELQQYGASPEAISTGADILRSTDTQELKEVLLNDIDINKIGEQLEQGYSIDQIMEDFMNERTPAEKFSIATKLAWSNFTVKYIVITFLVLVVINIILRWIIFNKAGKHGFAAIIPIYRDVTMLKICGLSPWWLLLLLVPVFGWIILGIIGIVMRFRLAFAFNKGVGFGFGLLLLGVIFEAIIAFNPNIKYVGYEE